MNASYKKSLHKKRKLKVCELKCVIFCRIELMWFDLKIGGAKGEIRKFVKSVANLLAKFKISAAKVQFSTQKAGKYF